MKKMTITERIRQANLKLILTAHGDNARLASALDIDAGYVSQLKTGHRPINEELARKIENENGKKKYWLDNDHSDSANDNSQNVNITEYSLQKAPLCEEGGEYTLVLDGEMLPNYPKGGKFVCVPFNRKAKTDLTFVVYRPDEIDYNVICEQLGSPEQRTHLQQLVGGRRIDRADSYYTYDDGEILCGIYGVVIDFALRSPK